MTSKAIRDFWAWFRARAPRLAELYEAKRFQQLSEEMNRRLDSISEELPWEIGPGKSRTYSLTLSPEGNRQLYALIQKILREAPDLQDWEFYSSRQPRQPPRVIKLPERNLSFRTERWRFIPERDISNKRIHLTILDSRLASVEREAALKAVSIFLDQFLGEDAVEKWVGTIAVAKPGTKTRSHAISTLPDYFVRVST